ncbi:hypothetical protein [Halostagnicola sp. A-GB9-2]|uniref:hypothetical protein n=1 Tax=Halostagnicola sp. A-GB9-2 TaxID=3048066 RepID=UPI0024BF7AE8|nr:hypothetical protein [Halostagnicola sp. A-GB9-2]MDJ1430717.1 hypothetical protein [Halostagnicola sp. A-GB9-2]
MDDRTGRLEYTRTVLEDAPTTRTSEYENADLEAVHRALEDRLENRAEAGKCETDEVSERAPPIGVRSELTGSETGDGRGGTTEGRLSAIVDCAAYDSRSFRFKPRGPHGAIAIIVGLIVALPTIFISLLLSLFGYYLYRSESEGEIPLRRWEAIDVLVIESASAEAGAEAADRSSSTVRATGAAESFVGVDTDRLVELPWAHRKAVVMEVEEWSKRAIQDAPATRNDEDVFFDYLTMWLKRKAKTDVETVESLQAEIARDPAARRAYTAHVLGDSAELEDETNDSDALLAVLEDGQ